MPNSLLSRPPRGDRQELVQVVRSVRNRWRLRILLRGAAVLLASTAALLLVAGWAIDASHFDPAAVDAARVATYGAFLVLLLVALVWPQLRRVTDQRVALYLEENEPTLDGRVISAVELAGEHAKPASAALVERVIRSAVEECRALEGGKRVERPGLRRASGLMAGSTAFGVGLFVFGPGFLHNTTPLLLDPFEDTEERNPYAVQVAPGDIRLARGADLKITATLEGFDAAEAELVVGGGESWKRWSMLREDSAEESEAEAPAGGAATVSHSLMLFALSADTEYYVEASGVRSERFQIEVVDLPYVEEIDLTYVFPDYTGLAPLEQPGSGDIAALVGTEVHLAIASTLPVASGALELDGSALVPLEPGDDGRLRATLTVAEAGTYRVLLDSEVAGRVVASPDYLIDAFIDQPPTLTLAKPGRDIEATALEEVVLEARAQDDYGVRRLEIVYSVNGGEEQTEVLYARRQGGRRDVVATHTFFLEDFELEPGDLVSYHARVRDGHRGEKPHLEVSDIYFLEIRPFDRNFRQADAGGGQQGGGMDNSELSLQQRRVIAATFKLVRDREDYEPQGFRENLATVALSQGRLREEAVRLGERIVNRGLAGVDPSFAAIAELLPQAAEAMARAEEKLGERDPEAALPAEQKALQLLQRAEAVFRDVQVSRGQQGGGGGGSGQISEELADLFELELDRLANQYEEVQSSRQQEVDETIDETLEKLRELARRQQQENERLRARMQQASQEGLAGSQAGSSGRSQRQLAEQAEEVARQLERLAREESLPELAATARQLRQAAQEMRRAAASGERSSEALGQSALEQLSEARRQLERNKSGRLERDTRQALERARELRQEQARMTRRVERLDEGAPGHPDALDELMRAKERMSAEVDDLERSIEEMSRQARRDQPEAADKLSAASAAIREHQIRDLILYSRGVVQQRSKEIALDLEQHIGATLGQLEERLEQARGAIGVSREQRLEQALEQTRETVAALEALEERLRDAGQERREGQGAQGNPNPNAVPPEGAPPRGRGGNLGMQPRDFRQLDREIGERRRQLELLEQQLRREGIDTSDLARIIGRLRDLGSGEALAGPETIAVLAEDIVQGLKELEYSLRRDLTASEDGRLLQASDGEVPDGYEEMVEAYYEALAGKRR